jgi:lipoprotein-anchoring transpeptidase ErfK/SrfK
VRARGWAVAATLAALGAVAGCSAPPGVDRASGGLRAAATSNRRAPTVAVSVAPADGSRDVRPDTPVVVTAQNGSISSADLVTADGQHLTGRLDGGGGWQLTDSLKPGTRYTLHVTAKGASGATTTMTSSFTTLTPKAYNRLTLVPGDDWTVGVGMPVVVTFASPVTNKDAAEKALAVRSRPAVQGAWRWMSPMEVQWRPASYWPSGARVKVTAAMGGVELSSGVWGRRTITTSFSVGAAQISTVDVNRHAMTVRRNGNVIRVIPVTTGKAGLLTRNGIKVIMSREPSVRMDAATTGTDPKDPNYYNILVHWAMRLTYSGEFLHAAPWSVAQQGKANVSHGCTGMSDANAKWMFDKSHVGDVVVFTGSPRPLEWGNGYTAWNESFAAWSSGR